MDAQKRAEEAELKIKVIVEKLPEDQMKIDQIPKDIDMANNDIQHGNNQGILLFVDSFG